jgi:hypothetical protein
MLGVRPKVALLLLRSPISPLLASLPASLKRVTPPLAFRPRTSSELMTTPARLALSVSCLSR